MKNLILFLLMPALAMSLIACGGPKTAASEPLREKTVKVMSLERVSRPEEMVYIGTVDADAVYSLSFKKGGIVQGIHVKKGDSVEKGMLLAYQESKDYTLASAAAQAQVDAQKSLVASAENAMVYSQKQYSRLESLYKAQALSESDFEAARLDADVKTHQAAAAREALLQAEVQASLAKNALNDSQIICPVDGVVVDTPFDEGELVGDGIPVVVLRTGELLVRIGVSQKDLADISLGMKAAVDIDGLRIEGAVATISQTPNPQTRTFSVDIHLNGTTAQIGSVAKVTLYGPERPGVLVPIEAIQASAVSYVYLVEENKVRKHEITRLQPEGAYVFSNELSQGDLLIVEGMKRVQPGDTVLIQEGGK